MKIARVAVHFQSVVENLSPHDTVFEFTEPSELKDSTLLSACSPHAALASIETSSDSPLQRSLDGVPEAVRAPHINGNLEHNALEEQGGQSHSSPHSDDAQARHEKVSEILSAIRTYDETPSTESPRHPPTSDTDKTLQPSPGADSQSAYDIGDVDPRSSIDTRRSSQSARPTTRDLYSAYDSKPKVKLGPRPSMDTHGRLDQSTSARSDFRPVSTLPSGIHIPSRKAAPGRPTSSKSQKMFSDRALSREPLPPPPLTPTHLPDRRPSISNNGLATPAKTPEMKTPKMTPEKRRLMKALQLRQKQMAAQSSAKEVDVEASLMETENHMSDGGSAGVSAAVDASRPMVGPNIVHSSENDIVKELHQDTQDSPSSVHEHSDDPSTQASSITEAEDFAAQKQDATSTSSTITPDQESQLLPERSVEGITGDNRSNAHYDGAPDIMVQVAEAKDQAPEELFLPVSEPSLVDVDTNSPQAKFREDVLGREPAKVEELASKSENAELEAAQTLSEGSATVEKSTASPGTPDRLILPATDRAPKHNDSNLQVIEKDYGEPPQTRTPAFAKSINVLPDGPHPDEVPLPPIDEDEGMSLGSEPAVIHDNSNLQIRYENTPESLVVSPQPTNKSITKSSPADAVLEEHKSLQTRRRGLVSPIKRVSSPDHSDEHFLSDDSFMEELKSATVQEAMPISVSKSPIKPVFARPDSEQRVSEASRPSRSVSSPLERSSSRDDDISPPPRLPTPLSSRSASASHPLKFDAQSPPLPQPKKIGVSSGISQRIKALEKLSSRPTSPVSSPSTTSAFMSIRKASLRERPATSDPNNGTSNRSRPSTAYPSPSPSPEVAKSDPINRFTKSAPESVSVTATIVRDERNRTSEMPLNSSEPTTLDLHHSPLVVEHQVTGPPPLSPLFTPRPRYSRYSSARSASSSSIERRGESLQTSRRESFASKHSMSSRNGSDQDLPRSISEKSLNGTTLDGIKEEKKDTKRSRLFRRMSSISSMSRRSIAQAISPGPKEVPVVEHHEPISKTPASSAVDVGDVNIQFPDTLVHILIHNDCDPTNSLSSFGRDDICL